MKKKVIKELECALALINFPERGLDIIAQIELKYGDHIYENIDLNDRINKYKYVLLMELEDYGRALGCIEIRLSQYNENIMSNHDLCITILDYILCISHLYDSDVCMLHRLEKYIDTRIYQNISHEPSIALIIDILHARKTIRDSVLFKYLYKQACILYSLVSEDNIKKNVYEMLRQYHRIASGL